MKKIKLEGIFKIGYQVVRFAFKLKVDDKKEIVSVKIKTPNPIYDQYFNDKCLFTSSGQKIPYIVYPIASTPGSRELMDIFKLENLRYCQNTGDILAQYGDWCTFYQVITLSVE